VGKEFSELKLRRVMTKIDSVLRVMCNGLFSPKERFIM